MALTQKQRAFVDAKAKGASNKNAAIAAGYSADTASQAGSRLAKNEAIVAALARKTKAPAAKASSTPAPAAAPEKAPDDQIASMLMTSDPKIFLTALMNDAGEDPKLRLDAAKALLPYVHGKVADAGKKEAGKAAAQKAGAGKFGSAPPPLRLVR